MLHEVFISYSHRNLELADSIKKIVEDIGYTVYLDRVSLRGGEAWTKQLIEAIGQRQIKPVVVLVATTEAVAHPDVIRDVELAEAIRQKLLIIPLEFDGGTSDPLLGNSGLHIIRLHSMKTGNLNVGMIERELRKSLNGHVKRKLDDWRAEADQWRTERLPKPSFWTSEWMDYFPDMKDGLDRLSSVALRASGGSGKSVLIAHLLKHLLANTDFYPVVIPPELLKSALKDLPNLLVSVRPSAFPALLRRRFFNRWVAPAVGEEVGQLAHRCGGHAGEQVAEVEPCVQAGAFGAGDDRVERGGGVAAGVGSDK